MAAYCRLQRYVQKKLRSCCTNDWNYNSNSIRVKGPLKVKTTQRTISYQNKEAFRPRKHVECAISKRYFSVVWDSIFPCCDAVKNSRTVPLPSPTQQNVPRRGRQLSRRISVLFKFDSLKQSTFPIENTILGALIHELQNGDYLLHLCLAAHTRNLTNEIWNLGLLLSWLPTSRRLLK